MSSFKVLLILTLTTFVVSADPAQASEMRIIDLEDQAPSKGFYWASLLPFEDYPSQDNAVDGYPDEFSRERLLAADITCVHTSDCPDFYECGVQKPGICSHKKVFPPKPVEIGGYFVSVILKALSNVAGLGGGSKQTQILMAMHGFDVKKSAAISSFSLFMTSLLSFIMNFKEKHPDKPNCVLIEYNLVTIMMPLVLIGSQLGSLILVLLPQVAIQIMLTCLYVIMGIQTVDKGLKLTRKENEEIKKKAYLA
jgi:hypothetical protein